MNALTAAKRTTLILMSLLLILTTSAFAKDKEQGYLGVMLQQVTTSMSKALQLDDGQGVMISKVIADGPAAKAGLEDGDVILNFDGKAIDKYADLGKAMRKTSPGDTVELEILRGGKRQTTKVELGEPEERSFTYSVHSDGDGPDVEFFGEGGDHQVMVMGGGHGNSWISEDGGKMELVMEDIFGIDRGFMGVELDDLNEQLGEYFGVDDGEGALISKVRDDSPAAKSGLKAGDVIVSVGGESVADSGDVHRAMNDTEPEQEVEVKIVRKGKKKTVKVTLSEMPENEFTNRMRAPHAPRMITEFLHDSDFPHGVDHDIRVDAPHGVRTIRRFHRPDMNDDDLDEVREELDVLREELRELKKELKK